MEDPRRAREARARERFLHQALRDLDLESPWQSAEHDSTLHSLDILSESEKEMEMEERLVYSSTREMRSPSTFSQDSGNSRENTAEGEEEAMRRAAGVSGTVGASATGQNYCTDSTHQRHTTIESECNHSLAQSAGERDETEIERSMASSSAAESQDQERNDDLNSWEANSDVPASSDAELFAETAREQRSQQQYKEEEGSLSQSSEIAQVHTLAQPTTEFALDDGNESDEEDNDDGADSDAEQSDDPEENILPVASSDPKPSPKSLLTVKSVPSLGIVSSAYSSFQTSGEGRALTSPHQRGSGRPLSSDERSTSLSENGLRQPHNQPPDRGNAGHDSTQRSTKIVTTSTESFDLPKTGTSASFVLPSPSHIAYTPPPEPTVPQGEGIIEQLMQHDLQRTMHPEHVLNTIVYDACGVVDSDLRDPYDIGGAEADSSDAVQCVPSDLSDAKLIFESRFESGNLRRAIQVYEYEYDLILSPDTNTRGNTQWYYFRVGNTRAGQSYKLNIINLIKPDSLYNHGMLPLMYSTKAAREKGVGWVRAGSDVAYFQNNVRRRGGHYYTLTFSITMEYDNDEVFLTHSYPYTYTNLQRYLQSVEADPKRRKNVRRRLLCQTLAGNRCELLTITAFDSPPDEIRSRKAIVVTARVHPGETQSSWMVKGMIDYLTGSSVDAKILLDNFVFKVVPMLNPDGVINGNYRCSLSGFDLNRQWQDPSRKLHPTIWTTKSMMKRLQEDREIVMYVDLHGHSRKKNIFMYGCENKYNANLRLNERVFPRLLWKNGTTFSFADCAFKIQKSKESTARIVCRREFNIVNSFTLEASFCGADFGRHASLHFTTAHWEEMAAVFCDTLLDYWDPDQSKVALAFKELQLMFPRKSAPRIAQQSEEDSIGSDTEEEAKGARRKGKSSLGRRKRRTAAAAPLAPPEAAGSCRAGAEERAPEQHNASAKVRQSQVINTSTPFSVERRSSMTYPSRSASTSTVIASEQQTRRREKPLGTARPPLVGKRAVPVRANRPPRPRSIASKIALGSANVRVDEDFQLEKSSKTTRPRAGSDGESVVHARQRQGAVRIRRRPSVDIRTRNPTPRRSLSTGSVTMSLPPCVPQTSATDEGVLQSARGSDPAGTATMHRWQISSSGYRKLETGASTDRREQARLLPALISTVVRNGSE